MAILPITVYGDKILRKKTEPVKDVDFKLIELIKDMYDTMHNASGIGLAANQIGLDQSVFILDISGVEGYEDVKPVVLINPELLKLSEETTVFEEGCLSLPDVRSDVTRPKRVIVKYFDVNMKEHTLEADELLARVIQHEYDHLQGVLFIDKIDESILKKLKKDLNRIKGRKIESEYPISEKMDYMLK